MYLSYPEGQEHPANAPRGEVENVHEAVLRSLGMTDSNFVAYPPPDSHEVLRYSTCVSNTQAYRPVGNKNTDSHTPQRTAQSQNHQSPQAFFGAYPAPPLSMTGNQPGFIPINPNYVPPGFPC